MNATFVHRRCPEQSKRRDGTLIVMRASQSRFRAKSFTLVLLYAENLHRKYLAVGRRSDRQIQSVPATRVDSDILCNDNEKGQPCE